MKQADGLNIFWQSIGHRKHYTASIPALGRCDRQIHAVPGGQENLHRPENHFSMMATRDTTFLPDDNTSAPVSFSANLDK